MENKEIIVEAIGEPNIDAIPEDELDILCKVVLDSYFLSKEKSKEENK